MGWKGEAIESDECNCSVSSIPFIYLWKFESELGGFLGHYNEREIFFILQEFDVFLITHIIFQFLENLLEWRNFSSFVQHFLTMLSLNLFLSREKIRQLSKRWPNEKPKLKRIILSIIEIRVKETKKKWRESYAPSYFFCRITQRNRSRTPAGLTLRNNLMTRPSTRLLFPRSEFA